VDVRSYRLRGCIVLLDEAAYFSEEFYPAFHVKNKLCRIYLRLRQPADSFLRNPKSLALLGVQKRRPTDPWELSKCTGCYFVGGLANSEHQVQHPYKPVRRCPGERLAVVGQARGESDQAFPYLPNLDSSRYGAGISFTGPVAKELPRAALMRGWGLGATDRRVAK